MCLDAAVLHELCQIYPDTAAILEQDAHARHKKL